MSTKGSGRFCIVPARAIEDRRLGAAAFRTLCCLGTYGDKDGWCFPSVGTVSRRLGITRQAVQRSLRQIGDLGYVETRRQTRHDGGDTANLYRLLFDRALLEIKADCPTETGGEEEQRQLAGGATSEVAPIRTTQKNERDSVGGKHTAPQFEQFWAVFPPRRPHSNPKKPARQKFEAALNRGVPAADIILGARHYGLCVARENTEAKYVTQAVTWLAQERWEEYQDEPEASTARKKQGVWL